jgi:hypothetical protein
MIAEFSLEINRNWSRVNLQSVQIFTRRRGICVLAIQQEYFMSIKEKKLKDPGSIFILLSLICLLLVSGSVLAQQDETNKLLGSWQRQSEGQQFVITFKPDGSGTLGSAGRTSSFQWNLNNNTLTMSGDGAQYINQVVITAETLMMTGKNMPRPVVWYRFPR